MVSDRRKQAEFNAGANVFMGAIGRSFPTKRVTFKQTWKQKAGQSQRRTGFLIGEHKKGR